MSDMIWNGSYTLGDSQETQITAGSGIKVTTPAAGQIQIAADETVLYNGNMPALSGTITFAENLKNFKYVDVCFNDYDSPEVTRINADGINVNRIVMCLAWAHNWCNQLWLRFDPTNDPTTWTYVSNTMMTVKNTGTDTAALSIKQNDTISRKLKVVGINRISGGN